MAAVYTGGRTFMDPIMRVPERFLYRVMRVDPDHGQDWKALRQEPDHLLARRLAAALFHPPHATALGLHGPEPDGLPLRPVERHVQHGLVVPDEHELAVLRRRDDDELLQPDGRAHRSELPLRRDRNLGRRRADPRHHRPQRPQHRQLLARHDPHDPVRADPDGLCDRADSRLTRGDPERLVVSELQRDHTSRKSDRDGPRRFTGGRPSRRGWRRRRRSRCGRPTTGAGCRP